MQREWYSKATYYLTYSSVEWNCKKKKNITVKKIAISMLKRKILSKKFWAKAINTTTFILNRYFLKSFRLKLSILQLSFSIDLQQRQSEIKLHLKHGINKNLMSIILKFLVVLLMLLFLLKAKTSYLREERNLSSLVIMMNQKTFDSSILEWISNFFPEMFFFFNLQLGNGKIQSIQN